MDVADWEGEATLIGAEGAENRIHRVTHCQLHASLLTASISHHNEWCSEGSSTSTVHCSHFKGVTGEGSESTGSVCLWVSCWY